MQFFDNTTTTAASAPAMTTTDWAAEMQRLMALAPPPPKPFAFPEELVNQLPPDATNIAGCICGVPVVRIGGWIISKDHPILQPPTLSELLGQGNKYGAPAGDAKP